jgi:hypothetical protein
MGRRTNLLARSSPSLSLTAVDGSEVDEQPAMTMQAHNASDAA